MHDPPERTRDYTGLITDTRVWDRFNLRAGDIILSTPPKCGTTWSQAILTMLLAGAAVTDRKIWNTSPWLDCGLRDQEAMLEELNAKTARRCIKSHSAFDAIPYAPDVTYICVYRHPIDMHFSMEKHVANMGSDILDFLFPAPVEAAFDRFVTAPATDTGTDDLTLASMLHHFHSFAKFAHLPNVHMFHYAQLSADLPKMVERYADAIGLSPDAKTVREIASACSFGSMKSVTRATTNPSKDYAFKVPHQFFDSATSNKWEGRLKQSSLDAYAARIASLATRDEVDFLENG